MDGKIYVGGDLEIVKPKQYNWKPQEDITPYELAKALEALLIAASGSGWQALGIIENFPESVRRHFEEVIE
jgi:hypothetical protein